MRRTGILLTTIAALTLAAGCLGVYTRLFEADREDSRGVQEFRFEPRMVSFLNHLGEPDNFYDNDYWISIKVWDTTVTTPKDINDEEHIEERQALASQFKERVLTLFRFDSLAIAFGEDSTRLLLLPDTSRYTPRDINYLSFQFGQAIIPLETDSLKAVFYYDYLGRYGTPPHADSLVYLLGRFERGESMMGLKEIVPARGHIDEEEGDDE